MKGRNAMRLYLDNCCFNRPFDDQEQISVKLETEAKLSVQERISDGAFELVWSYILEFENNQNPYSERSSFVREWKDVAVCRITATEDIVNAAERLENIGLKIKDALHIACAISANADFFLTTDKKLLNKNIDGITVINPIDFVRRQEGDNAE
jgi:predicted nucleic acid-binding protein